MGGGSRPAVVMVARGRDALRDVSTTWFRLIHMLLVVAVAVGALALTSSLSLSSSTTRATTTKRSKPLWHPSRAHDPVDVERRCLLLGSVPGHERPNERYTHVIGCDESGTGAIAGPVVVASCAILSLDLLVSSIQKSSSSSASFLGRVDDSKRLTKAEREQIYDAVTSRPDFFVWSTAVRSSEEIDESISLIDATMRAYEESIDAVVKNLPSDSRPYCIVDGHKTPSNLPFPCRPWPQGDATVYTVAVASVLARVIRDNIMETLGRDQYPMYGWHDDNGGYPSAHHFLALQRHGPTPHHRTSCRPVVRSSDKRLPEIDTSKASRGDFLRSVACVSTALLLGQTTLATGGLVPAANAMTIDPKTGISLPDAGEIEAAVPTDWSGIESPIPGNNDNPDSGLSRLDPSNDAIFYQDPRFVEHVDEQAVQMLTEYVSTVAIRPTTTSVLDLCSSWTSHLSTEAPHPQLNRVAGLGMNAQELQKNAVLTEWVVQDLNQQPLLPYRDNSFDCVLCQLSIDYLTRPLQVCREILRVLKPEGKVHILFSNRLFLTKAVALWTGADDVDHAFTVASYLHFCSEGKGADGSNFVNVQAKDLSKRGKDGRIRGDPLYVVTGVKAADNIGGA